MDGLPDAPSSLDALDKVDRLEKRLEALERRVHTLEHPLTARWPHPPAETEGAVAAEQRESAQPGSIFSVLGKALLGIAGAYVLRAVEELSSLPRLAVACAGMAYAFLWLAWAARTRRGPLFTSPIYAVTSALILAPMLWELTLRFKILPAVASACVVCGYTLAGFALARRHAAQSVLRVVFISTAALSLALAVASHVLLPFVVVLLMLAAACEFDPQFDRLPEIGPLVALAADAAIWILIYVYFAPQSAPEDYPSLGKAALLAPAVALFAVFAAGVIWKTVLRARPIKVFETAQTTIAFLLAAVSVADFGPPNGKVLLGVVCLLLSPVCYALVFTVFARAPARRNAAVFAAWSAALLLAGSFLCLPTPLAIALLGAAAIAATFVGSSRNWLAFELYGMVFLLATAAASGLLSFLVSSLVLAPPGAPPPGVWLTAACALVCYVTSRPRQGEGWREQAFHLAFAALAAGSVASLLIDGLVALTALLVTPGAHHLALIRTVTLCTAALVLAFGGARWRRVELTRLGYAALAVVALKLVTEDLHHGHLVYIAASIFLLALTLLAAARVARLGQKS